MIIFKETEREEAYLEKYEYLVQFIIECDVGCELRKSSFIPINLLTDEVVRESQKINKF